MDFDGLIEFFVNFMREFYLCFQTFIDNISKAFGIQLLYLSNQWDRIEEAGVKYVKVLIYFIDYNSFKISNEIIKRMAPTLTNREHVKKINVPISQYYSNILTWHQFSSKPRTLYIN